MTSRFSRFAVVGTVGFALQLVALGTLTTAADWGYVCATAMAVEIAALHNFWWHERWTWGDRRLSRRAVAGRLIRYHLTTAITSMTGNVLLTAAFVELAGAPVMLANAAAVAAMAAANFVVADQWVFARRGIALTAAIALTPGLADAAELEPVTLSAWNNFVEQAERRLHSCSCDTTRPQGTSIEVPGGTIHQWRGSVLVKGVTVDDVLLALTVPGTPPPQDDVLESRVLSRSGDSLRVYLKLKRRAIVTVTYDTEHDVTFSRLSPQSAASRSIATRISELDGADRGFLWRLNSYWRYTQQPDGVRIELESLSLSRRVPRLVRPAASPIINRVARESMTRTLDSVRRFLETRGESVSRQVEPGR